MPPREWVDTKVYWPESTPPDIFETQFSYEFCLKISLKNCISKLDSRKKWLFYKDERHLIDLLQRNAAHYNLIVTDPEIVLPENSLSRLQDMAIEGFAACGPVFNQSSYPEQVAVLPFPYCNYNTLEEVARNVIENAHHDRKITDNLDPGCFLLKDEAISIAEEIIHEKRNTAGFNIGIDPGALVHRFSDYYNSERTDLVNLIPEKTERILDVGCAMGGYGKSIKKHNRNYYLIGVEPNKYMAKHARPFYNEMYVENFEEIVLEERVDLVNCGDVLEHLYDPLKVMRKFYNLLDKGGHIVFSVPNIGHWSLARDLINGKFQYIPVGLQCISHIRWFTQTSLEDLVEEAGFNIETIIKEKDCITPEGDEFIARLCDAGMGNRESLETSEFIVRAVKK